jgi:hypothetical protein
LARFGFGQQYEHNQTKRMARKITRTHRSLTAWRSLQLYRSA